MYPEIIVAHPNNLTKFLHVSIQFYSISMDVTFKKDMRSQIK